MFIFSQFHPAALKLASSPLRQFLFAMAIIVAGPLFANQAQAALNCAAQPSCAELGYAQTIAADCPENEILLCPFDKSFKKCVYIAPTEQEKSCADLGFTQTNKSTWCSNTIQCHSNNSYTLCNEAKITETLCPIGYSKTIGSVSACGSTGSSGWNLLSLLFSEGTSCKKCEAKTCASGYAISLNNCGSVPSGWTISSTANSYAGNSACYLCTKKTCGTYGYDDDCNIDELVAGIFDVYVGDTLRKCYKCRNKPRPPGERR